MPPPMLIGVICNPGPAKPAFLPSVVHLLPLFWTTFHRVTLHTHFTRPGHDVKKRLLGCLDLETLILAWHQGDVLEGCQHGLTGAVFGDNLQVRARLALVEHVTLRS